MMKGYKKIKGFEGYLINHQGKVFSNKSNKILKLSNHTGYNVLPGGYVLDNGTFNGLGIRTLFWSSSSYSDGNIWYRKLVDNYYGDPNNFTWRDYGSYQYPNDGLGYSVRCIKD